MSVHQPATSVLGCKIGYSLTGSAFELVPFPVINGGGAKGPCAPDLRPRSQHVAREVFCSPVLRSRARSAAVGLRVGLVPPPASMGCPLQNGSLDLTRLLCYWSLPSCSFWGCPRGWQTPGGAAGGHSGTRLVIEAVCKQHLSFFTFLGAQRARIQRRSTLHRHRPVGPAPWRAARSHQSCTAASRS